MRSPERSKPREVDRVASIGLDLVAGLLRDQRRRDDLTGEPLRGQVAIQPVPARARLVREDQIGGLGLESAHQLGQVRLARADRADKHGRIGALPLGVGDRDRIFVDVETDEKRSRLCHG